ncbi:hypothetical protein IW261DRAFT_1669841 [Armillaria novae-zelandiae]|uniref:Uncharacterized protein n=1 Tax=Armillaria novae-zelandiae TaxID=153914 RepID=A0AA39PJL3_9AGAR|nr:hypothetical protein IW261DRAFT_1669841 [Armillaria novae-zelandiae]
MTYKKPNSLNSSPTANARSTLSVVSFQGTQGGFPAIPKLVKKARVKAFATSGAPSRREGVSLNAPNRFLVASKTVDDRVDLLGQIAEMQPEGIRGGHRRALNFLVSMAEVVEYNLLSLKKRAKAIHREMIVTEDEFGIIIIQAAITVNLFWRFTGGENASEPGKTLHKTQTKHQESLENAWKTSFRPGSNMTGGGLSDRCMTECLNLSQMPAVVCLDSYKSNQGLWEKVRVKNALPSGNL